LPQVKIVEEDDFEVELRKLQELDEDRVALGHKAMTDEERAKIRLSRLKTKKTMTAFKNLMLNEQSPNGPGNGSSE
jgi:hypothetical protein